MRRIAFIRLTPLWLDAVLLTCVVQIAFTVSLAYSGWPTMAAEWVRAPHEPKWWTVYFLPSFLMIYVPALIRKSSPRITLFWSTAATYLALSMLTPRFVE